MSGYKFRDTSPVNPEVYDKEYQIVRESAGQADLSVTTLNVSNTVYVEGSQSDALGPEVGFGTFSDSLPTFDPAVAGAPYIGTVAIHWHAGSNPVPVGFGTKLTLASETPSSFTLSPTVGPERVSGFSSDSHGYIYGQWPGPTSFTSRDDIRRFTFAAGSTATLSDVGEIPQVGPGGLFPLHHALLAAASSPTHGYAMGGWSPPRVNHVMRFPFSIPTVTTDIGELSGGPDSIKNYNAAASSENEGAFEFGGGFPGPSDIKKVPYASGAPVTMSLIPNAIHPSHRVPVGLSGGMLGGNSTTHGYMTGGFPFPSPIPSAQKTAVSKFPFAIAGSADVSGLGQLSANRRLQPASGSSESILYMAGTDGSPFVPGTVGFMRAGYIEKYPFASETPSGTTPDIQLHPDHCSVPLGEENFAMGTTVD